MQIIRQKGIRIFLYILGYFAAAGVIAFSLLTYLNYGVFRGDLTANAYAETSRIIDRVYATLHSVSETANNSKTWEKLGLDNAEIVVYDYTAGKQERIPLMDTSDAYKYPDVYSGLKSASYQLDYSSYYDDYGNEMIYRDVYLDADTPFLMIRTEDLLRFISDHAEYFYEENRQQFLETPESLSKEQRSIYEELYRRGYLDRLEEGDDFCLLDSGLFVFSPGEQRISVSGRKDFYLNSLSESYLYLSLPKDVSEKEIFSEEMEDGTAKKILSGRIFGSAFEAILCTLDESTRSLLAQMRNQNTGHYFANTAYSYDNEKISGSVISDSRGITDAGNANGYIGSYGDLVSKISANSDVFVRYDRETGVLEQWYKDPSGSLHDFSYIEDPKSLTDGADASMVLGMNLYNSGDKAYVIESFAFSACKAIPYPAVFLIISAAVFLLCVVLILWGVPAKLIGFDTVPYEICLIGAFVLLFLFGFYFPREIGGSVYTLAGNDLSFLITIAFFLILALYLTCACLFTTTARRIKCKAFARSLLVVKIARLIVSGWGHLAAEYEKALKGHRRLIILASVLFGVNTLAFLIIGLYHGEGILLVLILIIAEAFAGYQLLKYCAGVEKVLTVSRRIENGELSAKTDPEELKYNVKELGESLNQVGQGLSRAVESSIRDERTKAELITNVSHDIKTPLTSIISYVDLLKKEPAGSEKAAEYIDVLDKKSQRLKQLIMDLIEVSKTNTGNIELEYMDLDLSELLDQMLGEYEARFADCNLEVVKTISAENTIIRADGRRVFRIIDNIFNNVVKYAQSGTRVYIDLRQSGAGQSREDTQSNEMVTLGIKNVSREMLGISAEELTERFVRGDRSRHTEGSGLGLSIARNLTELQNGIFEIDIDGDLFKVQISFPVS